MVRDAAGSPASEIQAVRDAFIAALRRGDAVAAARAYTEDARLMAPSAELLTGRAAIEQFWRAGVEVGVEAIELKSLEVGLEAGGDVAYEIGRYVLQLRSAGGDRVVDRGRYLLVYRREADGHWRRAVETFNPDSLPASEAARPPVDLAPAAVERGEQMA
jgi:uncharacterized protein (TIGR02246 family)